MAYRLKLDESFKDGFVRIGLEQIERASRRLKSSDDSAVAVHESRKGLKRIRALLWLARPALGEVVSRRENKRFRKIGALLAHARDCQVLAETLSKLERGADAKALAVIGEFRAALTPTKSGGVSPRDGGAKKKAIAALQQAHGRFKKLKVPGAGFAPVARGLESCYRHGRKAFDAAYASRSDEAFHDWRKTVQQHWRQMALIARAWPEALGARVAEAKRLSELLGDDHDLAVLKALIGAKAKDGMRPALARDLTRLCVKRQRELRALALPHGRRLFAESPKDLRRRVEAYWTAARRIKERAPRAAAPDTAKAAAGYAPRLRVSRAPKAGSRT